MKEIQESLPKLPKINKILRASFSQREQKSSLYVHGKGVNSDHNEKPEEEKLHVEDECTQIAHEILF